MADAEAGTSSPGYSILDDPDLDQELLKQLSPEQLEELERKLAQVDAAFAAEDDEAPADVEDLERGDGGVMASSGKAAARGGVSGRIPKRITMKTQMMRKVVDRSRLLKTQPASGLPPLQPPPSTEDAPMENVSVAAATPESPPTRTGRTVALALCVAALVVLGIAIVLAGDESPTEPASDRSPVDTTSSAPSTSTAVRAPASAPAAASSNTTAPITPSATTVTSVQPPVATGGTRPPPPKKKKNGWIQ